MTMGIPEAVEVLDSMRQEVRDKLLRTQTLLKREQYRRAQGIATDATTSEGLAAEVEKLKRREAALTIALERLRGGTPDWIANRT